MQNILHDLYEQGKMAAIYTNKSDTSHFVYGRVLHTNDADFALALVTPYGEYDGVLVKSIDDILRIEVDGQYAQRMRKLCALNESIQLDISFASGDIKRDILLDSMKCKKVVALELSYSGFDDVVGIVEKVEESVCQILQIDADGFPDGTVFVSMDCITQISYDSRDERRTLCLYLTNKNASN